MILPLFRVASGGHEICSLQRRVFRLIKIESINECFRDNTHFTASIKSASNPSVNSILKFHSRFFDNYTEIIFFAKNLIKGNKISSQENYY